MPSTCPSTCVGLHGTVHIVFRAEKKLGAFKVRGYVRGYVTYPGQAAVGTVALYCGVERTLCLTLNCGDGSAISNPWSELFRLSVSIGPCVDVQRGVDGVWKII